LWAIKPKALNRIAKIRRILVLLMFSNCTFPSLSILGSQQKCKKKFFINVWRKIVFDICFDNYFWAYLMKVILSVPDEGYSERTWWRLFWAYLMKVILSVHDEGYFERTWWRLFLSVPDEGYFERTWWRLFWAYLMKNLHHVRSK
jgi:hypothetical protein